MHQYIWILSHILYLIVLLKYDMTALHVQVYGAILFLLLQLATAVTSSFALHRIPKKYAFVSCCFILSFAIASIATFSLLKSKHKEDSVPDWIHALDWIPLAGAMLAMICQSFGIMTTLQILMGEVFPTDIRAIAAGKNHAKLIFSRA